VAAIVIGALCSAFVSPHLAFASGTAFLVSELCDFVVYTPLARGGRSGRSPPRTPSAPSSTLCLPQPRVRSLALFWGQVVGKSWVTLATVALLVVIRALGGRSQPDDPSGGTVTVAE
jgi:hypothetical protein